MGFLTLWHILATSSSWKTIFMNGVCQALINLICPYCKTHFQLCRSCYRNHRYCNPSCSKSARKKLVKGYQHDYRKSKKGILRRRLAAQRARKHSAIKKTVGDHTASTCKLLVIKEQPSFVEKVTEGCDECFMPKKQKISHCSHCGVKGHVVLRFCRRSYKQKRGKNAARIFSTRVKVPTSAS